MRTLATAVALLAIQGVAWSDDRSLGSGANCAPGPIPADARRATLHGNDLFLYPVAPGAAYSGCQRLGAVSGSIVQFEAVTRFENGRVIAHRSIDVHGRVTECTYLQGSVVERRLRGESAFRGLQCPRESELQRQLTESPAN